MRGFFNLIKTLIRNVEMNPLIGWSVLGLSFALACYFIVDHSTQDLVTYSGHSNVDDQQLSLPSYDDSKERLARTISEDPNLHVETRREIQDLIITLNEVMDSSEVAEPYENDVVDVGRMPDKKTEAFLEKEYARLGLSYQESKARVKSILNADMTDPDLIELSHKISEGVAQ